MCICSLAEINKQNEIKRNEKFNSAFFFTRFVLQTSHTIEKKYTILIFWTEFFKFPVLNRINEHPY